MEFHEQRVEPLLDTCLPVFQEGKMAVSPPLSDNLEALENRHVDSSISLDSLASVFQPRKFGYKKGKTKILSRWLSTILSVLVGGVSRGKVQDA